MPRFGDGRVAEALGAREQQQLDRPVVGRRCDKFIVAIVAGGQHQYSRADEPSAMLRKHIYYHGSMLARGLKLGQAAQGNSGWDSWPRDLELT